MSKPLTDRQLYERYDTMLDEINGRVEIAGLEYATSYALKNVDETAYDTGYADWLDAEVSAGQLFEQAGEYYDDDPADDVSDADLGLEDES